jgi:ABC-type ATPase involved in cell division
VAGRAGPHRHGKSTLLNLLGGLDRPTDGRIELDGTDLAALRETQLTRLRAALVGFIFQTFNLIPTLSAAENVESALVPLGAGPADRRARIAAALAWPTGRPPAVGVVRRPAAAGRDRPDPGQRAQGGAGRRADRQPRPGHP